MTGNPQGNNSDPILLTVGLVFLMAAIFFAFSYFRDEIISCLMGLSRAELLPVSYFSSEAAYVRNRLAEIDPTAVTGAQSMAQLNYAGLYYSRLMWIVYALLVYVAWTCNITDKFHRKLDMKGLLRNNVRHNPCIAPIINWPRSILQESSDAGYWAVARQPIQVVAAHGLLTFPDGQPVPGEQLLGADHLANMESPLLKNRTSPLRFDRGKAAKLLKAQLGRPFTTAKAIPPYLGKLATAFYLFGTDRKKEGQALLDSMSFSFQAPSKGRRGALHRTFPYILLPKKNHGFILDTHCAYDLEKLLESAAPVVNHHKSYVYMVVLALYKFARKKGVLPTSEFIWLRPIDRRMFYLLNNVGRRTAWPEIAGAWAHFMAEEQVGASIAEPQVLEGVNALELAIYEEGWTDSLSAEAKKNLLEN